MHVILDFDKVQMPEDSHLLVICLALSTTRCSLSPTPFQCYMESSNFTVSHGGNIISLLKTWRRYIVGLILNRRNPRPEIDDFGFVARTVIKSQAWWKDAAANLMIFLLNILLSR